MTATLAGGRSATLIAAALLLALSMAGIAEASTDSGSVVEDRFVESRLAESQSGICSLFAPASVATNDRFGTSIGVDGEYLAVGAWLADAEDQRDAGLVHLYRLNADDSRWGETQQLAAPEPEPGAGFGFAVDLDANVLAVSAQNATVGSLPAAGAVYIFELEPSGSWVSVARLTAPNPATDDLFGQNLEVDGATGTVVVGAPGADPVLADGRPVTDAGAAHVFVRDSEGWSHQAELVDPTAKPNDRAGNDVAISGDWVVVGHHLDDPADPVTERGSLANAGGALVFQRTGTTWTGPTELLGSDPRQRDRAGIGVDIDAERGRTSLVMTGWAQEPDDRAVAWVFRHDGENWVEQARIEPQRSTSPGSHFGRHVELSGDLLAIGASLEDRGAVHYYLESDGFWLERAKVTPVDAERGALAGISVALSDEWVVLGAERAALGAVNSGGACIARRADVLDGSYAPDQRFGATMAVTVPPNGGGSPSLVVAGLVGGAAVVVVAAGLLLSRARSRGRRADPSRI